MGLSSSNMTRLNPLLLKKHIMGTHYGTETIEHGWIWGEKDMFGVEVHVWFGTLMFHY